MSDDGVTWWRTGRKVGRTLYLQQGPAPSDDDPLIGVMDTPALAVLAAQAVNGHLGHGERDVMLSDLGDLLDALGMFSGARPQPPHEVMQEAIAEVRKVQAKLDAIRDLAGQLVDRPLRRGLLAILDGGGDAAP